MAVITNQKNLQISFALDDGNGHISYMTLPIKPEELTRTEPNRVTAQQTLDGVFIDEFGRGLTTITISGSTGWGQGTRPAGDIMFLKLRDNFIHEWGRARRARIDASQDPNLVRLIFIDALNGPYVADVIPTQFVLRRSKSQPLLFLYNITMTVVAEEASNPYPELLEAIEDEALVSASVESMGTSVSDLTGPVAGAAAGSGGLIGKLEGLSAKIGSLGQAALAATKSTFGPAMAAAQEVIATANAAKRVLTDVEQATVNVAKELSATATKIWDAVGAVASLPADAAAMVMSVKGAFSNLGCLLSNGFTDAIGKAALPSPPYGSSNCSSTSFGGGTSYVPPAVPTKTAVPTTPVIVITPAAGAAVTTIGNTDLSGGIDQHGLTTTVTTIATGVTVVVPQSTPVAVPTPAPTASPTASPPKAEDWGYPLGASSKVSTIGAGDLVLIELFGGIKGEPIVYTIHPVGSGLESTLQAGGSSVFEAGGKVQLLLQFNPGAAWASATGMYVYFLFGKDAGYQRCSSIAFENKDPVYLPLVAAWRGLKSSSPVSSVDAGNTVAVTLSGGVPGEPFVYTVSSTGSTLELQSGGSGVFSASGTADVALTVVQSNNWNAATGMWVNFVCGSNLIYQPVTNLSFTKK